MNVRKNRSGFTLAADLTIEPGIITVLRGKSGAGKTTVADLIAGRVEPDTGVIALGERIFFDRERGISLPPEARGLGYVFQTHRLFPHLSVRENILFPVTFGGRKASATVDELADLLGIGELLERMPQTLSGGESQRAALARALMGAETMLLMDEPLASIDVERRDVLLTYIERIRERFSMPILYITHSDEETERLAGALYEIHSGAVRALEPNRRKGTCGEGEEPQAHPNTNFRRKAV